MVAEVSLLSEGAFAYIWRAKDLASSDQFALKKIHCADQQSLRAAEKEAETLSKMPAHPNIVRYFGHTSAMDNARGQTVLVLLELCEGGRLTDYMLQNGCLEEPAVLSITADVVAALCVLHSQQPPIAHRDVKPENVLRGPDGRWKLCDFGSCSSGRLSLASLDACQVQEFRAEIERQTTPMYRPPELADTFSCENVSEKVDIWMLGCLVYMLMFNSHPFPSKEPNLAIINLRFEIPGEPVFHESLSHLLCWLLAFRPADRPSAPTLARWLSECASGRRPMLPESARERWKAMCKRRELYADRSDAKDVANAARQKTRVAGAPACPESARPKVLANGAPAWPEAGAAAIPMAPVEKGWATFEEDSKQHPGGSVWNIIEASPADWPEPPPVQLDDKAATAGAVCSNGCCIC